MKAKIINITDSCVQMETDFGMFRGKWMSGKLVMNGTYFIEIDSSPVTDANQIQLSDQTKPFIHDFGDYILINGYVEEIEDNLLFLRLSYNLMMIVIYCDITGFQECWVRIKVDHFEIYGELIKGQVKG